MERPAKRLKITNPDVRNPRDTGSRMTEGLFTSEQGMRGDDTDYAVQPTRTISLSDFQRQNVFGSYQHAPRPVLPRRNAGIYLLPRAPEATVTASVVQVNVNDGTSTSKITEVTVAATDSVVSLSEVGTLTTAVSLTIPGISNTTSTHGSSTSSSQTTPPITSTITSSTSSLSTGLTNGTITSDTTSERTVTVTATSTFELSVINGTIIASDTLFAGSPTRTHEGTTATSSSSSSATFFFGDLTSTPTPSSDTSTSSDLSGDSGSSSYFTNGPDGSGAGSPTATTDPAATSSAGSGSGGGGGGGSPGLTPTQQQVVGGVVGGVAGAALTLVIILFVLRWYRRRLKARGQLPEQIAARELAGDGGGGGSRAEAYPMSQRSSTTPLTVAVAHGLKRLRPRSSQTLGTTATGTTDSSVPESERGFQRIAGRKIAPVLSSGGDPYGGNYGAFEKDAGVGPSDMPRIPERGLSGASFYQDNRGFYGGKGTPTPPQVPSSPTTVTTPAKTGDSLAPAGTASSARDFAEPRAPSALNNSQISLNTPSRPEGFAIMRPSPARTPVTLSPAASSIRLPIQQPPSMDENAPPLPPMLRDGVGRSLASQDGSRVSRSSGRSAGRFTENM
ncbi:hypothetical protein AYO20_10084 [Fonsecaea nubica]|uniref:Uncharacterized protein n=1 Tax=Fonsecaea nubica TaxID=856822 RepID=A0A178CBT1_9EURO|nr:hypothetical protein AYO20_10084 [Fonsecaea nubica]OAL26515.1 hypothetical protein AYO20_10084 [Fonsecaea nubica]